MDVLTTLNLYDKDDYYKIAGELLADENDIVDKSIIIKLGEGLGTIYKINLQIK